eukprot:g16487.t1
MKQQQQPPQQQATKPAKEKPLDDYIPSAYMACLEGTLLTNGDLKGSWRVRREDALKNDFCMVLVGKGLYDGRFNLQDPRASANASAPSILVIPDKWHSFEWMETTGTSCNVWGSGQNNAFGQFFTIGVHNPRQRRIVIYKVGEKEMLRAQTFARAEQPVVTPGAAKPDPDPPAAAAAAPATGSPTARVTTATTAPAAASSAVAPSAAAPSAAAPAASAATRATGASVAMAASPTGMLARGEATQNLASGGVVDALPRASSSSDIVAAAAMLFQATAGASSGSRGGGGSPRADERGPGSSDGDVCSGGGGGGVDGSGTSVEGSGGGPAPRGGRAASRPVAKMSKKRSMDAPLPVPIPAPVPTQIAPAHMRSASSMRSTDSFRFSLPGFSGRFDDHHHDHGDDASTTNSDGGGGGGGSVDELADLSILGARLQREKLRIQESAWVRRQRSLQEKERFQLRLQKAKEDEGTMLRAMQELRKKMTEDEQQLESATQRVQRVEEEERSALSRWHHKWETQVAPLIAHCENGARRKAWELKRKVREVECESEELKRELQRLESVKQIGDAPARTTQQVQPRASCPPCPAGGAEIARRGLPLSPDRPQCGSP